jgi:hypothetical protein
LVAHVLLAQEIHEYAHHLVLPRNLAGEIADKAFVYVKQDPAVWNSSVPYRLSLMYESIKQVVEREYDGKVSLFVYNDADLLGQALRQLDEDRAERV